MQRKLSLRTIFTLAGLAFIMSACKAGTTDKEGHYTGWIIGEKFGNTSLTGHCDNLQLDVLNYKEAALGIHPYFFNYGLESFFGFSVRIENR